MPATASLEYDEAGKSLDGLDRHLEVWNGFDAEMSGDLFGGGGDCVQPRHADFSLRLVAALFITRTKREQIYGGLVPQISAEGAEYASLCSRRRWAKMKLRHPASFGRPAKGARRRAIRFAIGIAASGVA
ncbi:hypothetical protein [Sphingomonas antarctica]|uniref:hypothetical protein n=1 Tax=Sphingomonas antarctica TaxID=2040274 RepID=UPI0039ED3211